MADTSTPRCRARRRTAGVMRTPVGIVTAATWATWFAAESEGEGTPGAAPAGVASAGAATATATVSLTAAASGTDAAAAVGAAAVGAAAVAHGRGARPLGASATSTSAMTASLGTVSPSETRICVSVPSKGDGTSALTLSVTTSTSGSPMRTWSPTALSHFPMVPCSTPSPSWGMVTWGMG